MQQNNQKYKQTPIGLIPTDWEVKKLGEVARFINGKAYKQEELLNEGKYKVLRVGNLNTSTEWYWSNLELGEDKYVNKGDLMYAWSASFGPSFWNGIKTIYHYHIWKVMPTIADKRYLYQYLLFDTDKMLSLKQGGTMFHITKSFIEDRNFFLPPLPEQQKIAEILSTWDKAIQEVQLLIKKIEVRNKALAFSLLRGGLVNKNSKKISLSKFLTFTPREIEKPTENYLALGIRSHGKGIFHKPDSDPKAISMDKLYEVKENDFIVNITFAWEHAVAIISKKDEGGLVSHRFPTYVIDQKTVSVEFFRHIILQPFFKQMLDNISPGGAGRNRVLSKKDLLKLEISVPSLEEQHSIAEILNTAHQELKRYQEKLKVLRQQKKGLMRQLLTGKIRTV